MSSETRENPLTAQRRAHRRSVDPRLEADELAVAEGPDVDNGDVDEGAGLFCGSSQPADDRDIVPGGDEQFRRGKRVDVLGDFGEEGLGSVEPFVNAAPGKFGRLDDFKLGRYLREYEGEIAPVVGIVDTLNEFRVCLHFLWPFPFKRMFQ